ncbi:hypothetical protein RT717_03775 [Imperialibacter roseus]|uniref:DUF4259 domain-containing protein n=1 Tax=Imperialibacter roseus TaxID=1324217 RepID=A0ABZ0IRS1_9BACT|nr:hypothetical protein [Imperialibacter roseus]WOK07726.1 hypothetical protein RT717_03695 [Imperialibacter roseus]WOK07742.1 hypothetical protein RT717_03775 [Imperialibacter roseus]
MGTWGTAIKDSDAFADVYSEFFELYNAGGDPKTISKKIIEDNWEILEIEEEKHSLWFAIALAQWETKSLDEDILRKVETIVTSGADLSIWRHLGASEPDLTRRKVALKKFLDKIQTERPKAKPRKKLKLNTAVFSTGECLVFKMRNGNYGGAVVLATDADPETPYNLVATTRINKRELPSLDDFEKAEVLLLNFGNWTDKPDVVWYMPDLYFKEYSSLYESIGKIDIEAQYKVSDRIGLSYLFKPSYTTGWNMSYDAEKQFESELTKPKPTQQLTIKQLIKGERTSKKWWDFLKKGS